MTNDNLAGPLDQDELQLLVFSAKWCGPCRASAPIFEKFSEQNPGIPVTKIDVDDNPDLVAEYGVMSVPTTIILKQGVEKTRFPWAVNVKVLENAIQEARG